ncbi:MAG: hypothetical protein JW936_04275 [Sedimentisphaerales bacterium]|nr:hypothetical protein [Sedimentisphaerales bacterium]
MKPQCNEHLRKALQIAEQLLKLADKGDDDREDVNCGVLYGAIRDSAYKIRTLATEELKAHRKKEILQNTTRVQTS